MKGSRSLRVTRPKENKRIELNGGEAFVLNRGFFFSVFPFNRLFVEQDAAGRGQTGLQERRIPSGRNKLELTSHLVREWAKGAAGKSSEKELRSGRTGKVAWEDVGGGRSQVEVEVSETRVANGGICTYLATGVRTAVGTGHSGRGATCEYLRGYAVLDDGT